MKSNRQSGSKPLARQQAPPSIRHAGISRSLLTLSLLVCGLLTGCGSKPVAIGSKAFTESAVLGETLRGAIDLQGVAVEHKEQLGGTGLVWSNLVNGRLDLYPDYTGTVTREIIQKPEIESVDEINEALKQYGIQATQPLGFDNSYELGMRRDRAVELGIEKISDLAKHPELKYAFGPEFHNRPDGWPGLKAEYSLSDENVSLMEHSLSYQSLKSGDVDVIDIYSTDAAVERFDVMILDDDREFFPKYECIILYREDLAQRAPKALEAIRSLEGKIPREQMTTANALVDVKRLSTTDAAKSLAKETLGLDLTIEPNTGSWLNELAKNTGNHLFLVIVSMSLAVVVSIPLGVLAAKRPRLEPVILSVSEIVQTIPGLALLVLLLKPLGWLGLPTLGATPTIIALFLYSLLPVIRNTYAGLQSIPTPLKESAEALGMTHFQQLWQVELPLASPMIVAGIKTTAVINVGYATLGGLIGAGGYGDPIMQGLYTYDIGRMLQGAVPAAVLAVLVKFLFELIEKRVVPASLRGT